MLPLREMWEQLLGPIKREFIHGLKDDEIDELYAAFMAIDETEDSSSASQLGGAVIGRRSLHRPASAASTASTVVHMPPGRPKEEEPSAEEVSSLFSTTNTQLNAAGTGKKLDFYSFLVLFEATKQTNPAHFAEDLQKARDWGAARVDARAHATVEELLTPKRKIRSPLEIAEDERLDAFIRESERCWNCKKCYDPGANHDTACEWHPGPRQQHTSNQNHLDRVLFKCCGAQQVGPCLC